MSYAKWIARLDSPTPVSSLSASGMLYLHFCITSSNDRANYGGLLPDPVETEYIHALLNDLDAQQSLDLFSQLLCALLTKLTRL